MFCPSFSRWLGLGNAIAFLLIIFSFQVRAESVFYHALPLPFNQLLTDNLTTADIPTGEGGFARDYRVELQAGDQVVIELKSDEFDPLVVLIGDDGSAIGSNDDAAEGGTNSLLYARIKKAGSYTVRVRTFGVSGGGRFTLKFSRLQQIN